MTDKYILDASGNPIPCDDLLTWGRWFETANRKVGNDTVGDVHVSTIFLGLDHWYRHGEPLLFETMVFGGRHDGYQARYATRDQAVAGHQKMLSTVLEEAGQP